MGAVAPHVIVIARRSGDNLKDFIAYAKANPGKLNFASVGQGSVPHLGGVMLNKAAGIDLVHVPYKGAGPATADIVAGQVELLIVTPPSVSAHIRSGAVKALALASEARIRHSPTSRRRRRRACPASSSTACSRCSSLPARRSRSSTGSTPRCARSRRWTSPASGPTSSAPC